MDTKNAFERLFILNYIGQFDNGCFSNATKSYLSAKGLDPEIYSKPIKRPNGKNLYRKEYNTARTESSSLLNKPHIQKLKQDIINEKFGDIDNIKNRHLELAMQNKNLVVAKQANTDLLKIYGILSKKNIQTNIEEIEILTEKIKRILSK